MTKPFTQFLHKKPLQNQNGTERDLEASKKIATNNGAKTNAPGKDKTVNKICTSIHYDRFWCTFSCYA